MVLQANQIVQHGRRRHDYDHGQHQCTYPRDGKVKGQGQCKQCKKFYKNLEKCPICDVSCHDGICPKCLNRTACSYEQRKLKAPSQEKTQQGRRSALPPIQRLPRENPATMSLRNVANSKPHKPPREDPPRTSLSIATNSKPH